MYILERKKKYLSLIYIMYASASNNTLPTLMLAHTWYEESIPWELYTLEKNNTLSLSYVYYVH